jgi:hypothetical protein
MIMHTIAILRVLEHLWWLIGPVLCVFRCQEGEYAFHDERPCLWGNLRLESSIDSVHVRSNARCKRRKAHGVLRIRALWELWLDHVRADLAGTGETQNGAMS